MTIEEQDPPDETTAPQVSQGGNEAIKEMEPDKDLRVERCALRKSVEARRGLCGQLGACGTGCTIERGETKVATEKTEEWLTKKKKIA